jgi:hypothetical protein
VGQRWGYRGKQTEPVTCVEVKRLGTGRPPRVLIKFVGDEFEGREEWVSPARLKVLWTNVDAWRENEQRWANLRDASDRIRDTPEDDALWMVIDHLREWDLARALYNNDSGILLIRDVDAVAADLDLDRDFLTSEPASFVDDDGSLVVPWRITRTIVERLARKHAGRLLPEIEAEERESREHSRSGYFNGNMFIRPETCADTDREYAPARELVRQWCGAEAQDRYDELVALRAEVQRLGKLIERAISAVRKAGDGREATALERELGIPLEVLRRSAEPDQGP